MAVVFFYFCFLSTQLCFLHGYHIKLPNHIKPSNLGHICALFTSFSCSPLSTELDINSWARFPGSYNLASSYPYKSDQLPIGSSIARSISYHLETRDCCLFNGSLTLSTIPYTYSSCYIEVKDSNTLSWCSHNEVSNGISS